MRIAFIRPDYPNEDRVAILPEEVAALRASGIDVVIELGFGTSLGLSDRDYATAGASLATREVCYSNQAIFNLKLTQPSDFPFLRPDHVIIGWTHPYGSGSHFYQNIAGPLGLTLVDVDSVNPRIFRGLESPEPINCFPAHMFWKNSFNAGVASVRLGIRHLNMDPDRDHSVCVLGSGSVAQGAFHELSKSGFVPRMFYRKTLPIFESLIGSFDVIVNGIEVDAPGLSIIDRDLLRRSREDVRIVEAAADAGNAVWGTEYQALSSPVGLVEGRRYVLVNNAPTIIAREASSDISRVVGGQIIPAIRANLNLFGLDP